MKGVLGSLLYSVAFLYGIGMDSKRAMNLWMEGLPHWLKAITSIKKYGPRSTTFPEFFNEQGTPRLFKHDESTPSLSIAWNNVAQSLVWNSGWEAIVADKIYPAAIFGAYTWTWFHNTYRGGHNISKPTPLASFLKGEGKGKSTNYQPAPPYLANMLLISLQI